MCLSQQLNVLCIELMFTELFSAGIYTRTQVLSFVSQVSQWFQFVSILYGSDLISEEETGGFWQRT